MNESDRFKLFKDCCKYWIDRFALHEYWWMFKQVDETMSDGFANVLIDHNTMSALVEIRSDVFEQDESDILIRRIAFHEICETMLTVFEPKMTDQDREAARHSVLNKIAYALGV